MMETDESVNDALISGQNVTTKFECPICHRVCTRKCGLDLHLKTHTGEKPYKCEWCEFSSRQSYKVYKHVKAMHPTVLMKFECDECHQDFPSKFLLRMHKKQHMGNHECEICSHVFTRKKDLTQHKKKKHAEYFEKPFKCSTCARGFTLRHLLTRHEERYRGSCLSKEPHLGDEPYSCDVCNKCFSEKDSYERHLTMHTQKPYECEVCHTPCSTMKSLKSHQERHKKAAADRIQFKCDICKKTYPRNSTLMQHKETVHGVVQVRICTICSAEFANAAELRHHRKVHVGEKCYECDICYKTFYEKSRMLVHRRKHTGEKPFLCELCGKRFHASSSLRVHFSKGSCKGSGSPEHGKVLHIARNQRDCPICQISFMSPYTLKTHLNIHPTPKFYASGALYMRFKCDECERSFPTEFHRSVHKCKVLNYGHNAANVNDDRGEHAHVRKPCIITLQPLDCRNAVQLTESKNSSSASVNNSPNLGLNGIFVSNKENSSGKYSCLRENIMDQGKKAFPCITCNKRFASKNYLSLHSKSHSNYKPYRCEVCDKPFWNVSAKYRHKRIHSGEREYSCDVCGKGFSEKSYLLVHRRLHSGEKPFKCELCEKRFSHLSGKYHHKQVHSSCKQFMCTHCGKAYSCKRSLHAHSVVHSVIKNAEPT